MDGKTITAAHNATWRTVLLALPDQEMAIRNGLEDCLITDAASRTSRIAYQVDATTYLTVTLDEWISVHSPPGDIGTSSPVALAVDEAVKAVSGDA